MAIARAISPWKDVIAAALFGFAVVGCHVAVAATDSGPATGADGADWPSYGGTYSEDRFSPLTQINADNVGKLGLAWSLELPDVHSGVSMPLEVDGVLYFTVDQSMVRAVDVLSGKQLWLFDPEVDKVAGVKLRNSWGPRGIAYWDGKVYVGTTDGRLIAIDCKTGKQIWSVLTVGKDDARTITGAPRVFDGLVVIGQGGGDHGPVRGYVTAYDARTGEQRWRFYTVPGNPTDGFENEAMRMAAQTWKGDWWKYGGGGAVWNAITYDPEFDTVYLATGNGAPWNQKIRSPGGGDNLFIASIVALDAKTGNYKWHYQEVPGDTWDFDATMDMTLATVSIDGKPRKVLLQAPKDGFFYVIDRATGKLISAEPYAKVTWASGIDLKTGRPKENPGARYPSGEAQIQPASSGAHSWIPQAYSPITGFVYIPTLLIPGSFNDKGIDPKTWKFEPGRSNLGVNFYAGDVPVDIAHSSLVAWDPIHQRKVWSASTPGFWNGGAMTTAGNLVFQGQADGYLVAYAADTGKKLWSFYCGMGITGAPISYWVNGKQYVSVVAGWGGGGAGYLGAVAAQHGWVFGINHHRLLTFALGATGALPSDVPKPQFVTPLEDEGIVADAAKAAAGAQIYARTCVSCHGAGVRAGGYAPDLRASPIPRDADAFAQVVRAGGLQQRGMPQYGEFSDAELDALRNYIIQRAHETRTTEK